MPELEARTLAIVAAGILVALVLVALAVRQLLRSRGPDRTSYLRALDAAAAGETAEGIRLLREAVEEDTDNVGAYLHLGRLLRQRGDVDRALRIHTELGVRKLPGPLKRRVLVETLADLIQAGRWSEARSVGEDLRSRGPVDAPLLRSLGRVYENLREWDRAWDVFEELEKRRSEPSKRRLALYRAFMALDYEKRGKVKEAIRHYQAALKHDPGLPGALLHLGDIQLAAGEVDRAIESWKQLIRANPNTVSLVFDRLEQATYQKDPARMTELAAEYERVLADAPDDLSTMRALARLHRRRGDVAEALRVLDHALQTQPDNTRLRMERIRMLMESGEPDAAYAEIRDHLLAQGSAGTREFTCTECGYRSEEYLWRCPACHRWETFEE